MAQNNESATPLFDLTGDQREIVDFVNGELDRVEVNPLYLFVSGEAGTGKTAVLCEIRKCIVRRFADNDSVLVMAPIGAAAVHVNGTTIHSAFSIKKGAIGRFDDLSVESLRILRQRFGSLKLILLDEVSLISNVMLAEVDYMLQQIKQSMRPFGGISIIFFGDLYQLPPVSGDRVFEALSPIMHQRRVDKIPHAESNLWRLVSFKELHNNIRTMDPEDRIILKAVRNGPITVDVVDKVRTRCPIMGTSSPQQIFDMLQRLEHENPGKSFLVIAPTNQQVDILNSFRLNQLGGGQEIRGRMTFPTRLARMTAQDGTIDPIRLAVGLRVMLTRNIDTRAGLVNGAIGILMEIAEDSLKIRLLSGMEIDINRVFFTDSSIYWEQFPIKISEASTIHKIQGSTLDGVVLVTERIFGDGSMYTALSRARDLKLCRLTCLNYQRWTISPKAGLE